MYQTAINFGGCLPPQGKTMLRPNILQAERVKRHRSIRRESPLSQPARLPRMQGDDGEVPIRDGEGEVSVVLLHQDLSPPCASPSNLPQQPAPPPMRVVYALTPQIQQSMGIRSGERRDVRRPQSMECELPSEESLRRRTCSPNSLIMLSRCWARYLLQALTISHNN
jgi:hypothetical protein